jgi:hypothetical protein
MQQRSLQQVRVSVSLIFLIHGLIIATWAEPEGNWSAAPSGGLPFEVPYEDVKRWNPAGDKFRDVCRPNFLVKAAGRFGEI